MKTVYQYIVFVLLIQFCTSAHAQESELKTEYSHVKYNIENGMSISKTICLAKDDNGFIWIGTYAGLTRYNGFEFESADLGSSFSVSRIEFDKNKKLKAFCRDGYNIVNGQTLLTENEITFKEKLYLNSNPSVLLPKGYGLYTNEVGNSVKLCEAKDSSINVIASNEYLDQLAGTNIRIPLYDKAKKLIYIPLAGKINIVSESGKLISEEKNIEIYSFIKWNNGVYAIGLEGLYKLNAANKLELIYKYQFIDFYNGAYGIDDGKGHLLIKDAASIYRFDGKKLEQICSGLTIIRQIMFDREGNLWACTNDGIFNFFNLDFRVTKLSGGQKILAVATEKNLNTVWIGESKGSLFSYRDGVSKQYFNFYKHLYAKNENVSYCLLPSDGDAYAIMPINNQSVLKLEKETVRQIDTEIPDNNGPIVSSVLFSNGNMALLKDNVVYIVNQQGKIISEYSCDGVDTRFFDLAIDKQNRIWIGGSEHISLIEENKITTIPDNGDLSTCRCIQIDKNGIVWFLSSGSLYRIKDKKIEKEIAYKGVCFTFKVSQTGKIVIPTEKGIFIYDPATKKELKYDKNNGFTGLEPEGKRIAEDAEGNIIVCTTKGLFIFNPDKLMRQTPPPLLQVLSVAVSDNNVDWKNIPADSLTLNHSQNNLILKFIGLSYSLAGNVLYQYRLRGFQDEWSNPVPEREIRFNNLSPGHYTFELKCNAGSIESAIVSLPVYIRPAFWQTWWFNSLLILLLAAVVALIVFHIMKVRQEKVLRRLNRQKEINELRVQSIRLKSIPHFNANVLAGIEYFIMTKSKEEANQLLSTYSRFTNITLHSIDKAQRSLKEEVDYVRMYLELEKMRYSDKLMYSIEVDKSVNENVMLPNMILHTYTENAIKHGVRPKNTGGNVWIRIADENEGIRLSVEDNGLGRKASALRNAQLNRTGSGLSILSRQIELYNQQNTNKIVETIVDLTDEEGNAMLTRFELYVPYEYEYV